jgi:hypothetical protein
MTILKAYNQWWKRKGQHSIGGNTNYEVWAASWRTAEDEWHRLWHRDMGIPCDETEYCPLVRIRKARRATRERGGRT